MCSEGINRRHFITSAAGLTGATLICPSQAIGGPGIAVAAYHGETGSYHDNQFHASDGLAKKGYRLRSLSVYRDLNNQTLYAAVWTTEAGPPWVACHGKSGSEYQGFADEWTSKGYRPIIVTATGGGEIGGQVSDAEFAAVFILDSTPYYARHGLDWQTFKDTCTWAKQNQHVLRWATAYSMPHLFAGIWEKRPNVSWDYTGGHIIDSPYKGESMTMYGEPSLRLNFVTGWYGYHIAVYRDDQMGQWAARFNMSSHDYQVEYTSLKTQNFYPMLVQAEGDARVGTAPSFIALFEKLSP